MSNKNSGIAKKASDFITTEEMEKKKLHILNEDTKLHSKGNKTLVKKNKKYREKENKENLVLNACKIGNLDIIEEYLNDHDVNNFLSTGWTLLLHAASSCNVKIVEYLLTHGANADLHKDGFTPLMALCSSAKGKIEDYLSCLFLLIEASNNVEAINNQKLTALMYACKTNKIEIVSELIKYTKNINAYDTDGYTALMYAVLSNGIEIVKLLLNNHADATIKNNHYETAKDIANLKGYEEISSLLPSENDISITYEISRVDEWKHMFHRLCPIQDQVVKCDISDILHGMGLRNYTNLFQGMELQTFLQLTEKDLINLKMDISIHRDRFLKDLCKFHCKTWKMQSIGAIRSSNSYTFYDGILSMGIIAKQILVMTSTFHYIRKNISNDSCEDIFGNDIQISKYIRSIKKSEKALVNMKQKLLQVKTIVKKINVQNTLDKPPCYIGPKTAKSFYFKPIIFSILLVCGIYLTKVQVYK
ncbi:hypothetical protein V1478_000867 [Vespula squamosa]|uniref:SAM domain-containing protein n=1 Tax=Vespula squamosa TaxID=30214 RepID=A0ABD2C6P6_VESSQ